MLDVYPNKNIVDGTLEDFRYVDRGTYKITESVPYQQRFYGGPCERVFGRKDSLQKIPLIFYTGREIYVNDHYYYPWNINSKAKFCSYLLHYRFFQQREKLEHLQENQLSYYDGNISISIDDITYHF